MNLSISGAGPGTHTITNEVLPDQWFFWVDVDKVLVELVHENIGIVGCHLGVHTCTSYLNVVSGIKLEVVLCEHKFHESGEIITGFHMKIGSKSPQASLAP